MPERVLLLACGIFAREFKSLDPELQEKFKPTFFDSMLHMDPAALDGRVAEALPPEGTPVVILYGDCSPHMLEFGQKPACGRARGVNCCEICLGAARYRELRKAGSFFFMPEWMARWETVFKQSLGLEDRELAREFMRENMRELVYLDTGAPRPGAEVFEAASDYIGLELRIEKVGTTGLEAALRAALLEALDGN
ncbi:MAG: hypothetical protein CVV51_00205 [Spirochaetae bacterium HGW-Spirochaetae-7]|jgi:hypothetical protein|nr:MAG: hypothetical protein CVV51_00205 [Spirochaetae bacterium HGW-Spirochaetae-7]